MENEFGVLLRRYRERAGLSQNALARQVEIDQSYVNRLERGDREPPTRPIVARLAEALGLAEADRQRFLLAAGHMPDWLLDLAPDDPTLPRVAAFLASAEVSDEAKQDFRRVVALLLERWRP